MPEPEEGEELEDPDEAANLSEASDHVVRVSFINLANIIRLEVYREYDAKRFYINLFSRLKFIAIVSVWLCKSPKPHCGIVMVLQMLQLDVEYVGDLGLVKIVIALFKPHSRTLCAFETIHIEARRVLYPYNSH